MAELFRDHLKHFSQLSQSRIARIHERIAAGNGWNLRNPETIFLAIENRLVTLVSYRYERFYASCLWDLTLLLFAALR
jgi:hypothetical protein